MKISIASFLILSTSLLVKAEEPVFIKGNAGVSTYAEADHFCAKHGLAIAEEAELCAYVKANPLKEGVYGMAPLRGEAAVDVEAACGITKAPTPAPTLAPTATPTSKPTSKPTKKPTSTPVGQILRTSAAVGRTSVGGRALEEAKIETVLCTEAPVVRMAPIMASGSGDPHFKTWTGAKFDYHGECDLVLVDNPTFANGLGLKVHIRTTRIKYFSYIEQIAVQIGEDILEFNNDVDNFMINSVMAEPVRKFVHTKFAGYVVRRDPKAISIRLNKDDPTHPGAKIDLISRSIGFPSVVLDGGNTDVFKGSLGLLGDYSTGKKVARDGETELDDATAFALEWQVRDTEPMLFQDARFPQFPTTCTPPKKMLGNRLGKSHMEEEAGKVCAHWKEDKEDCIFDVIATRDVSVAGVQTMAEIEASLE